MVGRELLLKYQDHVQIPRYPVEQLELELLWLLHHEVLILQDPLDVADELRVILLNVGNLRPDQVRGAMGKAK